MARKKGSKKRKTSGAGSKTPPKRGKGQLFEMLKEDHKKVKGLFSQIEEDGEMEMEKREKVFSQIEEELNLHMEGEEKFFYPPLEKEEEAREKILEAYEEHHVAKTVLGEFGKISPEAERWMAKVMVLKEIVEHHIEEEEKRNGLFSLAKSMLDEEQTKEIASRIESAKQSR